MTHDDKFEAFLAREAARLDEPTAVPREAMWEAIAAARAARGTGTSAVPVGDAIVQPITLARSRRVVRYAPWIGMAATLLLGVGIGRYALQRVEVDAVPSDASSVASSGSDRAGARAGDLPMTTPVESAAAPQFDGPAPGRLPRASTAPRSAAVNIPTLSAARPESRPSISSNRTYVVASNEHITRAEALVAVVSAMPADAMMDSLTGRWARDILQNTRLLLDSPAGADPVRRQLLEDLENVLVQLVQRSGRTVEDKAMIDRTLQRTQLLTRLRSGATGT